MPFADIRVKLWKQRSVFWENIHVVMNPQIFVFIAGEKKNERIRSVDWMWITSKTMLYKMTKE
jgi:NhaP-type Na+/H+ or K+/H+ antiporter